MNFDKKNVTFLGVIALVLASGGFLAIRDSGIGNGSSEVTNSKGSESPKFVMNSSEIMFAQGMIPHHEQAIYMSELALEKSSNQEVLDLASQIKAAQAPEITQMKSWLDRVDAGYVVDHDMGMNGMLSDSEISALSEATGRNFDRLFLQGMIQHHEGAIEMAALIESSSNEEIKTIHDAIVKTQSEEITKMKAFLKTQTLP